MTEEVPVVSQKRVDRLDRSRTTALKGFVASYVLWQVTVLVDEFLGHRLDGLPADTLFWLALALGLSWLGFGARHAWIGREISADPALARALDDERARHIRGTAYTVGFWSLGAFLIAVRLVAFAVPVPGTLVAQLGIAVALASAVIAYLVLDRG